jgi:hypothetical protein
MVETGRTPRWTPILAYRSMQHITVYVVRASNLVAEAIGDLFKQPEIVVPVVMAFLSAILT